MSRAQLIDGKKIADEVCAELTADIAELKERGIQPKLVVVLIGDDPASAVYVRMKAKKSEQLGIISETLRYPAEMSQSDALALIDTLNNDKSVNGILVQMPLPGHLDADEIIDRILPEKDVDGFHPVNKGLLQAGKETMIPCTPYGIQEMLRREGFDPSGKEVVVVGRSQIVGMPIAILLSQKAPFSNATVTICHSNTKDIAKHTRNADIVIAAVGRPHFITADMLSEKTVVIDVGVNRVEAPETEKGYKLVGDVDFDAAVKKVKAITPVPGGVGPMTIAMLMVNTVKATRLQHSHNT